MDTPCEVCEKRDVKGLYKKAREGKIKGIQSSLRTKDILGTGLLSFARRLSLSQRFMIFQPILIVLSLNKLVNALKCMIRAVEMIIKWLVCSVFSVNIAQAEFFLFLKYWLLQNRYLDSRQILLSCMRHIIATA